MSFAVRPATHLDIDWILSQLKSFAEFNGTKLDLFGADPSYQHLLLTKMINEHLFLICEKMSESDSFSECEFTPIGFLCGMYHNHHFNPAIRVLTEQFWWVDKEYRTGKAGLELFNKFLQIGEEKSDWITFSLLNHSPVKPEFLHKHGFKMQEMSFLKEVVHG